MKIRLKLVLYSVTASLCLVLCGPVSAASNLVANPGFETGDFTDWIHGGNTGATGVASDFDAFLPHSGDFFAFLGPVGSDGTLSQDLATTAGQSYTFSWFLGSDGATPNDFSASWNGATIFSATDIPTTPPWDGITSVAAYDFYSFDVVATGATTTIEFAFRNDPAYLAFDDISVTSAVPEPSSLGLSGIGILIVAAFARRRRRCAKV